MGNLNSLQTRLPRAVQDLARGLDRAGSGPVAWAGPGGELHYRLAGNPYVQMEELSATAQSQSELLGWALGWFTARGLEGMQSPLTVVLESEPDAEAQEVLLAMATRDLDVLVILLDLGRWSTGSGWLPFSKKSGQTPAGLCQQLELRFLGTVDARKVDRLERELEEALSGEGLRVLHVKGESGTDRDLSEGFHQSRAPGRPAETGPVQPRRSAPVSDALLNSVLERLASDLPHECMVLWASSAPCGSLGGLRQRLVRTSVRGCLREAWGVCLAGLYPVLAVPASSLPELLPDLLARSESALTLLVMGGGLSGAGSHYHPAALSDLALLRLVPDLATACPADEEDALSLLVSAPPWERPVAVRFTSAPSVGLPAGPGGVGLGTGRRLRPGRDAAVLAAGSTVFPCVLAAESLRAWGIEVAVYDMRFVRPLDLSLLSEAAGLGRLVTVEEHRTRGGLGTAVLEGLAQLGLDQVAVRCLGLPDTPLAVPEGPPLEAFDLHAEGIARSVRRELGLQAPDEF